MCYQGVVKLVTVWDVMESGHSAVQSTGSEFVRVRSQLRLSSLRAFSLSHLSFFAILYPSPSFPHFEYTHNTLTLSTMNHNIVY